MVPMNIGEITLEANDIIIGLVIVILVLIALYFARRV
jgi:hypothetical protein